jgi:hypothetical protein
MSKPEARLFSIQILWRCVAKVKDFRQYEARENCVITPTRTNGIRPRSTDPTP